MYPIDVPHLEKICTSHVPHLELFVPHSRPYQMATLLCYDNVKTDEVKIY
jgi:hypothetical protein